MPAITSQASAQKLHYRMQQVLQYRTMTNLSDVKIAERVGLSIAGLKALMQQPDYLEMEESAMAGRVSELQRKLADDTEALTKEFKYAVPAALEALVEVVTQRRDLRARMAAAKEILDRDPTGQFVGAKKTDSDTGRGAPSLPSDIVASLNTEGNKTVAQIKAGTKSVNITVETVNEMPPDAGKHNA
jgi:hypothetical protein